jgi:hypothetical protein
LVSAFPWLAGLATNYEAYLFRNLAFQYMPMVGTQTPGAIMLAVDYDVMDPKPTEKVSFMQTHGAIRVSAWDSSTLVCDSKDLSKLPQRYTRKTNPFSGNGDQKTYDVGQLMLAYTGFTVANPTVVGELYVSYDIELITPQPVIYTPETFSAKMTAAPATATLAKPLGDAVMDPNPVFSRYADGVLTFQKAGQYLVSMFNTVTGGNTSGSGPSLVPTGGAVVTDLGVGGYQGTTTVSKLWTVAVNTLPATLSPVIGNGPTLPITGGSLRVAPYLTANG